MGTQPVLTHLDARGQARMVDISAKSVTVRSALARARVRMKPATLRALVDGTTPKGDVLAVARIAGIQAAKRTPELIPMCHQVQLTSVKVELTPRGRNQVLIEARATAADRTGVEMEALTAASVAALALYDMLKAIDRDLVIEQVALYEKHGGKSGDYQRAAGPQRRARKTPARRARSS